MRTLPYAVCAALALGATVPATPVCAQPHTELTIGMTQFPPDMHPYITNTSIKDYIAGAVRRPMTGFTAAGEVVCVLCTEVPSLANGRARLVDQADGSQGMEVRFTLKPDLFWGDGVPITAADVAFAFTVSQSFQPSATVDAVEADGPRDVRVHLKRVTYQFDRDFGPYTYMPLPEHIEGPIFRAAANALDYGQKSAINRHPEMPGLWSGPYLIGEFRPNEAVTLVPNPFWKGARPHFRKVTMRLVENTAALQANLLAGDVDLVAQGNLGITLDQVNALAKSAADKFDIEYVPAVTSYEHLALNTNLKLLGDKRVRQAMAMAIDRKTIIAKLFEGRLQIADSFMHPSLANWDKSVKTWPYDPKAARAKLAEAGFKPGPDGILLSPDGDRFSLDFVTTAGNRIRELVQQVLQSEFKAVGIELVVKNVPPRVFFGETVRKRDFKGMVMFQSDPPLDWVPAAYFHSRFIPSAENNWSGINYSGLANPDLDAALDAAVAELDPVKRKALWKTILDITADEQAEIDLYFATSAVLTPKWLTGVRNTERFGVPTLWLEDWRMR